MITLDIKHPNLEKALRLKKQQFPELSWTEIGEYAVGAGCFALSTDWEDDAAAKKTIEAFKHIRVFLARNNSKNQQEGGFAA